MSSLSNSDIGSGIDDEGGFKPGNPLPYAAGQLFDLLPALYLSPRMILRLRAVYFVDLVELIYPVPSRTFPPQAAGSGSLCQRLLAISLRHYTEEPEQTD